MNLGDIKNAEDIGNFLQEENVSNRVFALVGMLVEEIAQLQQKLRENHLLEDE